MDHQDDSVVQRTDDENSADDIDDDALEVLRENESNLIVAMLDFSTAAPEPRAYNPIIDLSPNSRKARYLQEVPVDDVWQDDVEFAALDILAGAAPVTSTKRKRLDELTAEELDREIEQVAERVAIQKAAGGHPVRSRKAAGDEEETQLLKPIPGATRKGGLCGGFWKMIENGSAIVTQYSLIGLFLAAQSVHQNQSNWYSVEGPPLERQGSSSWPHGSRRRC